MSPITATVTAQSKGIKGKRVSGKPGRFDPTEPFHMSTRGNKNNSISNSAPSVNGSVDDGESRRQSIDADRPVTANSNGTQASKGTYASDFSPPQPIPDVEMTEAPLEVSPSMRVDERKSRSRSPAEQTSPVTRKRKRSSPSPPPARVSDENYTLVADETDGPPLDDDYDSDTVEVVRQDQMSDRAESITAEVNEKEEASPNSSRSQEAAPTYDPMAATSVDATPLISEQPSPATSGSADGDNERDTAIAKPLAAALKEVADAKNVEVVEPEQPEDEPMLDAAQAIEDADEIEEQVRSDEEGRVLVRKGRFGGRRRAQHPNVNIEVAMRRQAQLKSAYRTLARVQKSILAEVATRTIDDIEANSNLHTEVAEYEGIIRGLEDSLAKRKATIRAQHEMRLEQLRVTWSSEQDAIVAKCRQQLEDVEETKVDQLHYEFLRIARSAQLEDGDDTEDEDDVIPRPKRTAYHFKRGAGIDLAYDSRSRLAIETQRAARDMQVRYDMYEMLKELPDDDKPEKRRGFAVMDDRPRTAADKTREGLDSLDMLVDAGNDIERRASIPVIRNDQALGLQMLSDLATRPSITGSRPESSSSASRQGLNRAAPPPLSLQVPRGNSPIQIQMSPRTQHAMGNRFDSSQMPPPATPRLDNASDVARSPELRRHERTPSTESQRHGGQRVSGFTQAMREVEERHRRESELNQRIADRDGELQNHLFGSPAGQERRFPNQPGWRQGDAFGLHRKRAASHSDPVHPPDDWIEQRLRQEREWVQQQRSAIPDESRDRPTQVNRFDPSDDIIERTMRQEQPWARNQPAAADENRDRSTPFDPVRSEAMRWSDQHSQAGASNGRSRETASPRSEQRSILGTPAPQNSTPGQNGAPGDPRSRRGSRDSNGGNFRNKTNKAERNGLSRRDAKIQNRLHNQRENAKSEPTGTPTMGTAQHAGSPLTGVPPRSPWLPSRPPGMPTPSEYPPGPFAPRHHAMGYPPPQPQGYGPPGLQHHNPPGYPHHQGPTFQQSTAQILSELFNPFPRHPQVPPSHAPPPPPGVERPYASFGAPPRLPGAPPPPPPPQSPFRGPQIAPNVSGTGSRQSNHKPAFAQQQELSGGEKSGNGRGRSKSESTFPKFMPQYTGPKERR